VIPLGHALPALTAAFLAALVEAVEALTVILAVGGMRGWRWALWGTAAALATLLALCLVLGPALALIPLRVVQVSVGALLLLFGLRWLRKAILRSAGALALHDEDVAYAKTRAAMGGAVGRGFDATAFAAAYQIVMLEGIEVVFIVLAIGAGGPGLIVPAALGAAAAVAAVFLLGLFVHKPLARVPENTLKFIVAIMLCAFGAFWVGEGIGIDWPYHDGALIGLIGGFGALALGAAAAKRPVLERA
jgi:uncharacterized membrane protein